MSEKDSGDALHLFAVDKAGVSLYILCSCWVKLVGLLLLLLLLDIYIQHARKENLSSEDSSLFDCSGNSYINEFGTPGLSRKIHT